MQKIIDLLLYGNFFIAFCAAALLAQTEYILYGHLKWTELTTFTFAATLCIYALHRLVGMKKVRAFKEKYRYHIIEKYRMHILLYAIGGGLVSAYLFFKLTYTNQFLIILPAFLAMGYVFPFFGKQRRLRDFHYLKIFLIAIVWAFITVVLPIIENQQSFMWRDVLILLERMLFVFAITIPFDIRDLYVDQHIKVKTIPAVIGEKRSKQLAFGLLFIASLLAGSLWYLEWYATPTLLAILCTYLVTSILIQLSNVRQHDYFFTGLMDGTMILQFLLVLFFGKIF